MYLESLLGLHKVLIITLSSKIPFNVKKKVKKYIFHLFNNFNHNKHILHDFVCYCCNNDSTKSIIVQCRLQSADWGKMQTEDK